MTASGTDRQYTKLTQIFSLTIKHSRKWKKWIFSADPFSASITIDVVKIRGVFKDGKIEAQIVDDKDLETVTVHLTNQDGMLFAKAAVNIGQIEKGEFLKSLIIDD